MICNHISHKPKCRAKEAHFSLALSRALKLELHDEGVERGYGMAHRSLKRALKGHRSYQLHHGLHEEAGPGATGNALPTERPGPQPPQHAVHFTHITPFLLSAPCVRSQWQL